MSIKDETIVIVEIPHQGNPKIWHADDRLQLIWKADEIAQDNLHITWTAEEVKNCWGEDDAPSELVAIIEQHGSAVEAKDPFDYDKGYYPPHSAPSAIEVAKEYIGHDLSACHFLDSEQAAQEYLKSASGHMSIEATSALSRYLRENKLWGAAMYCEYIDRQDQQVLDLLIKKILADGHHIGVSDGEETVLDNSSQYGEVVEALGGTGEDWINVLDAGTGKVITAFYCIYGNASKDYPSELFADYYVHDYADELVNHVEAAL